MDSQIVSPNKELQLTRFVAAVPPLHDNPQQLKTAALINQLMAGMEMISTSQSRKRGRERERKINKYVKQLCYRESWNQPSVKIGPREMT